MSRTIKPATGGKFINEQGVAVLQVLQVITRMIVGGAQETVLSTAALLDKRRFHVEVLCGAQTGSEGSLIKEACALGIPLTILPDLVREINPWRDLRALLEIYRIIKDNRYIIVHTHSSKAGILGRAAAWLAGTPIIVHTVHGWSFHDYMSPLMRRVFLWLERRMAACTNAFVVVSSHDMQKGLREKIGKPEQYHRIRSAIPLEEFDPVRVSREQVRQELGLPLDAPVLGNVGRFSPQKNPLAWVRVASIVAHNLPKCHFLLIGDGPLRAQVEEQLVKEGIAERTILTGLRRDVPRMLAAMDVFLLTSLWEGLPRVIPQALAMQVPVVAQRVGGVAEAILHNEMGYLCYPGDLEELAKRCVELLQNGHLRREMGRRGREHVLKEFPQQQMIEQLAALYENLLVGEHI